MYGGNKICYNFIVSKELYESRTVPLIETVGKDILDSGDQYFLIGSYDSPSYPNLLKLSNQDHYYSVIDKTLKCLEYHYITGTDFDWIFIGDDDTFVNVKRLNQLIHSIKAEVHKENDLFVVGATRNSNGTETPEDNFVSLKGGAGYFMNRNTYLTIRNFCSRHNYEIRWGKVSDYTIDLIIQIYNSNNLDNPQKQIVYLNCYNMIGDINFLNDEEVYKYVTIHNKNYAYPSFAKTMYQLQKLSTEEKTAFGFNYAHFRSPSELYYTT